MPSLGKFSSQGIGYGLEQVSSNAQMLSFERQQMAHSYDYHEKLVRNLQEIKKKLAALEQFEMKLLIEMKNVGPVSVTKNVKNLEAEIARLKEQKTAVEKELKNYANPKRPTA
jgi:hypothetical protein